MRPLLLWLPLFLGALACAGGLPGLPSARYEVLSQESDGGCSKLLDYCTTVTCVVKNVGNGSGPATVDVTIVDEEGKPAYYTESIPVDLGPGDTRTITHDFAQAKLQGHKQKKPSCTIRP